jgi:hypothetical protein
MLLTKVSATDYDTTWTTVIPGDRYLTTSVTSNSVSNGNKTFTIGTGLSYTPTQNLTISYNAANHMHGEVLTYNSGTGVLTVDINHHTGSGTYTSWVVNVGGVTPATSVAWGAITGTLSDQTDLNTALSGKAPLASPTFTGTVTIPSGASISGFALLASPTFTGDPKSVTPLLTDNDTSIATTAYVKGQGYLTSATAASTYYLQTNPSGFITSSALTGYALQNGTTAFSVTSNTIRSLAADDNFVQLNETALQFGNLGTGVAGLSVSGTGITFADATVQTTAAVAGVPEAPIDGTTYGRLNGTWTAVGGSGMGTVTYSSPYLYDTVGAANISTIDLGSGTLTSNGVTAANVTLDASGIVLAASSGAVITFPDTTTQSTAPHDIPFGGATGEVLTKNSASDYDVSWVAPSGGGGVDIQTFGSSTTSGTFTWTKPANAKYVEIILWAGGGGSGSGGRQATSVGRGGGSGGSGGGFIIQRLAASELNATETVTVGAGGTGGASVTIDSTTGTPGTAGGDTNFKNWKALGGNRGLGGFTANNSQSAAVAGYLYNQNQANGNGGAGLVGIGQAGGGNSFIITFSCGGAGGGGAAASGTTNVNGANGGGRTVSTHGNMTALAGGSAGTSAGVAPTAGSNSTTYYGGGTGGGSGAYRTGVAGMAGAAGGWPSGGGGGGSGADNGFASGSGAAGGKGYAVIITYT